MAVHDGGGRAQVEHHAGHPVGLEGVAACELGVGRAQGGAPRHARVLDRQRGDVVVGGDGTFGAAVAGRDADAGHLAAVEEHLADPGTEDELHPEGAQVGRPGVDPGLAGGRVEDAVDIGVAVHAAAEQAPQEQGLDDDAADGPGRRHLRAGGDEVAGLADAEEGPVLLAHLLGADEVPPRGLLPDLFATGVAAGQVDEEAVGEVGGLVGGEAGAEVQHREELVADPAEGEVAGAGRGGDTTEWEVQVGAAAGAGEQGLGAADEVVVDATRVAGDRDAAHGVRQVPVEAGEKRKPCSAGRSARPPVAVPGTGIERALPPRAS